MGLNEVLLMDADRRIPSTNTESAIIVTPLTVLISAMTRYRWVPPTDAPWSFPPNAVTAVEC
jgi:hypothetical protein